MTATTRRKLENSPCGAHWKRIGIRHHHGFCIPLFSLHSKHSCGIGEFPDLLPIIDWCKEIGYDLIQLLPINDTGIESSPYSAMSAFALNPVHLGLAHLPNADKHEELKEQLRKMQECCRSMRVDYKTLLPMRNRFLRSYYALEGEKTLQSPEFKAFRKKHTWLDGYAVFKTLKEKSGWKPHAKWDDELQKPTDETIAKLCKEHEPETTYHIFIQFHCFNQMHHVEDVAEEKGVHILGDIPILLGRESADIWQWHSLFKPHLSAGVPPDIFAPDGQNWELPIYNWKNMREDGYRWWKMRLDVASLFYDIYRIDHILGLYRIWAIPYNLRGRKGFYEPSDPDEWIEQGETIIQMMLDSTDMFPVGEDLGFLPANIYHSLRDMGIAGWKIVMWERDWDHDSSFIPFDEYPPACVITLSTHDTPTLRGWWQKNEADAREFAAFMDWEYTPSLSREQRIEILRASHKASSLFHINMLQEYLSLFDEMTFENPEDERPNIPNTVSAYNWSIRYVPSVEEIVSNSELKTILKNIIA